MPHLRPELLPPNAADLKISDLKISDLKISDLKISDLKRSDLKISDRKISAIRPSAPDGMALTAEGPRSIAPGKEAVPISGPGMGGGAGFSTTSSSAASSSAASSSAASSSAAGSSAMGSNTGSEPGSKTVSAPVSETGTLPQPEAWWESSWDVVIVGAGAAGLYTALCLPETVRALILTKEPLNLSASDWAQGGIAAVVSPEDSVQLHLDDTLVAGAGLCDRPAVALLVEQAADCIASLVALGVGFDRQGDRLALTREAAHSRPRVLHAADRTGRAVVATLAEQVLARPNLTVVEQALVLQLWTGQADDLADDLAAGPVASPGAGPAGPALGPDAGDATVCQGICVAYGDRIKWLRAQAVVLATGGGGQVFSHSTNPSLSTGDGVAIAHRAGGVLRDLEFVQFHPTALCKVGAPFFLISEAVRGEGAHLVDERGDRFAFRYHPAGELAPRDVVSRAIFQHLQQTRQSQVWLDLRPIPPEQIQHRFPNIVRVCQQWGIDPYETPIPVAPAAHYWMGGVLTDLQGQSSIQRLYAVGEASSTGVHGANRLASNSLLECLVFGRQVARASGLAGEALNHDEAVNPGKDLVSGKVSDKISDKISGKALAADRLARPALPPLDLDWGEVGLGQLQDWRAELGEVLWQSAGICRDAKEMEGGLEAVMALRHRFDGVPISQQLRALVPGQSWQLRGAGASWEALRAWFELDNLLTVGELLLKSALFRQESRGGHYRLDCPDTLEDWRAHTLVAGERWWRSAPIDETH